MHRLFELGRIERLLEHRGNLLVRPRLKAARGDNDYRDAGQVRVRLDLPENLCAVDVRKGEVQRDEVGSKLAREPHGFAAVLRDDDAATAIFEEDLQDRRDGRIVFDHEDRALKLRQYVGSWQGKFAGDFHAV